LAQIGEDASSSANTRAAPRFDFLDNRKRTVQYSQDAGGLHKQHSCGWVTMHKAAEDGRTPRRWRVNRIGALLPYFDAVELAGW
jgi:hypothetical protein